MTIRLGGCYSRTDATSGFCERMGIAPAGHYSRTDAKHAVRVGTGIHESNGYTHTSAKTTRQPHRSKPKGTRAGGLE